LKGDLKISNQYGVAAAKGNNIPELIRRNIFHRKEFITLKYETYLETCLEPSEQSSGKY
jgi:hypothetical protein